MLERGSPNSIPIMECGKVSAVWGVMGSGGGVLGVVGSVVCDAVWSGLCGVMGSGVQCGVGCAV